MLHILRSENAIDAEAETDAEMGDVAQQPPAADREVEGGEVGSRRVRAKTVPSGPALVGKGLSVAHLFGILWRILEKVGCDTEFSPLNYISMAHAGGAPQKYFSGASHYRAPQIFFLNFKKKGGQI